MKKNTKMILRINIITLAIILMTIFALPVNAQLDPNNSIDNILNEYRDAVGGWQAIIVPIARAIFWTLVLIDMVLIFGRIALEGGDLQAFTSEFIRFIIVVGFGALLLQNPTYIMDLVNGFRDVAAQSSGSASVSPGGIFDHILLFTTQIWNAFSIWRASSYGLVLVALIIFVCFVVLAAWLMIAIIEMYIVINGAIVLLGFFGSRFTRDYSMKYLGYAVSVGVKLMAIQMIMGIGFNLIEGWLADAERDTFDLLTMAGTSIVMVTLVVQLPSLLQSFVGAASGMIGGGLSGAGLINTAKQGAGMAAGAAAGAGRVTVGGAMSVSEAARLADSQGKSGFGKAGGTIKNLGRAAVRDIVGGLSGNLNRWQGSMPFRMAFDMKKQRIGDNQNNETPAPFSGGGPHTNNRPPDGNDSSGSAGSKSNGKNRSPVGGGGAEDRPGFQSGIYDMTNNIGNTMAGTSGFKPTTNPDAFYESNGLYNTDAPTTKTDASSVDDSVDDIERMSRDKRVHKVVQRVPHKIKNSSVDDIERMSATKRKLKAINDDK